MALFPFYRYRFFDDPFFLSEFDFFDPWFDFHPFPPLVPITPQLRWFKQHERLAYSSTNIPNSSKSLEQTSRVPQSETFLVQPNVDGFNPDTNKNGFEDRQLIVDGKPENRREERTFTSREMRETYEASKHSAPSNKLAAEVPIQNLQGQRQLQQATNDNRSLTPFGQYRDSFFNNIGSLDSNFQPRIVDKGNNQKQLEVTVGVKNYRPEEIKVSVTNNELIVQGEHKHKDANGSERLFFFKSATLPPGTQVDQLQSFLNDDGQLRIEGPVLP